MIDLYPAQIRISSIHSPQNFWRRGSLWEMGWENCWIIIIISNTVHI